MITITSCWDVYVMGQLDDSFRTTDLGFLKTDFSGSAIAHLSGVFLCLDLLFAYWIKRVTMGFLHVIFLFSTMIFYSGIPGFATDFPGVWCHLPPNDPLFPFWKLGYKQQLVYKFDLAENVFYVCLFFVFVKYIFTYILTFRDILVLYFILRSFQVSIMCIFPCTRVVPFSIHVVSILSIQTLKLTYIVLLSVQILIMKSNFEFCRSTAIKRYPTNKANSFTSFIAMIPSRYTFRERAITYPCI